MRRLLVLVVVALTPSVAQARYLHMDAGRAVAERYARVQARFYESRFSVDGCWLTSARVVQCFFTLNDVCDVDTSGGLGCGLTITQGSAGTVVTMRPDRGVVTVVLDRDGIRTARRSRAA